MPNNIGMLVTAPIRPVSIFDKYPVALQNEIKGGMHSVANLLERNTIPIERRCIGLFCYVASLDRIYYLKDDITNDHWLEFENMLQVIDCGTF